jgi:hypothetical protein
MKLSEKIKILEDMIAEQNGKIIANDIQNNYIEARIDILSSHYSLLHALIGDFIMLDAKRHKVNE